MPDPFLSGNGRACPDCAGAGQVPARPAPAALGPAWWPCPACDGLGRVAIHAWEIIALARVENAQGPG